MIAHREYAQKSVDWMIARAGIPTASEFDSIFTPEFQIRAGEMPKTYLAMKLAEAWQGGPLAGFNTFDMDMGNILEEEAVPWYELEFGEAIDRIGFITTDDGRVGCSPDGLISDDCGIEIKCPHAETHIGYLLAGKLPRNYAAQVHGSMFVTGRKWWKFLSYRRHFPPLLITVQRDEAIQKTIAKAMSDFLGKMDDGMKRLTELNGGPPSRRAPKAAPAPEPEPEETIP